MRLLLRAGAPEARLERGVDDVVLLGQRRLLKVDCTKWQ